MKSVENEPTTDSVQGESADKKLAQGDVPPLFLKNPCFEDPKFNSPLFQPLIFLDYFLVFLKKAVFPQKGIRLM